jgi:2-polyprenyl-6-hydroxyphenyl methylase/3-demethylubiquinone-9 3-methyltransferase
VTSPHDAEITAGTRFAFGENWSRFLGLLNDERIAQAERSLCDMLKVDDLRGRRFLDAGSGSGLFSLAARRLGATVHSFDFDPQSVACTAELKRRYCPDDSQWTVQQGSVLDDGFIAGLGQFDVVYSWGVLHHTGKMFTAFANVAACVAGGGSLFIAIYNEQGHVSRYWAWVKRTYNANPAAKALVIAVHAPYLFGLRWMARTLTGRRSLERGMSLWHDMLDWLGGYPFEVARPEAVFHFFQERGFTLAELKTCGGRMGCNEFVFTRTTAPARRADYSSA